MSEVAILRCCATAPVLEPYEAATDALLAKLGVGVVELDFNCCGYPLRNSRQEAWVRSSARNLAVAERAGLDLVTVCACCYGSLRQAGRLLEADAALRDETNGALAGEDLRCSGSARVRHLLQVLRDDVGVERLRALRRRSFAGLRVACHYGCHLLRPSAAVAFEDPASPSSLDALVEATGAETVAWGAKLDCCGSPVSGVNDELAQRLGERKLRSARDAGADVLCVVCPWCWLQLDRVRTAVAARGDEAIPIVLVHQLVGLSLGISAEALGMSPERPPVAASAAPAGARHG